MQKIAAYDIIYIMDKKSVAQLNPLSLAFVGDAVYGLFVKSKMTENHDLKTGMLTRLCDGYLKATAQAQIFRKLCDILTPDEMEIARRCRNSHVNNKAKNSSLSEYKKATALEGVLGYLYLAEEYARLNFLLEQCLLLK